MVPGFLSRRNRTRVPCIELYIYAGFPRIRPNGLDLGSVGIEKLAEMRSHSLSELLDTYFLDYFPHLSGASVSRRDVRSLCAFWSLRPTR